MQPSEEQVRIASRMFLKLLGVPTTESNVGHVTELARATLIYDERNTNHYRDLWMEYGWEDSLTHMRSKVARVKALFTEDDKEADLDDAFDLINYSVFFIRNVKDGNRVGTPA